MVPLAHGVAAPPERNKLSVQRCWAARPGTGACRASAGVRLSPGLGAWPHVASVRATSQTHGRAGRWRRLWRRVVTEGVRPGRLDNDEGVTYICARTHARKAGALGVDPIPSLYRRTCDGRRHGARRLIRFNARRWSRSISRWRLPCDRRLRRLLGSYRWRDGWIDGRRQVFCRLPAVQPDGKVYYLCHQLSVLADGKEAYFAVCHCTPSGQNSRTLPSGAPFPVGKDLYFAVSWCWPRRQNYTSLPSTCLLARRQNASGSTG